MVKKPTAYLIIFGCILLLLFVNKQKISKEYYDIESIGNKIREVNLTDTSMYISSINDLMLYNDSILLITDRHESVIRKYNLQNGNKDTFGRKGKGPGEFIIPNNIVHISDTLYINDERSSNVSKYTIDGKFLSYCKINTFVAGAKMIVGAKNRIMFIHRGAGSRKYLADANEEYYDVQKCFKSMNIGRNAIGGFEYKGRVYFMNPYEMKILYYDSQNQKCGSITLKDIKPKYNWEPYYNTVIGSDKINNIIVKDAFLSPRRIIKMEYNNNLYFIVLAINEHTKKGLYYIFNEYGNKMFTFYSEYDIIEYKSNRLKMIYFERNTNTLSSYIEYEFNHEVGGIL